MKQDALAQSKSLAPCVDAWESKPSESRVINRSAKAR